VGVVRAEGEDRLGAPAVQIVKVGMFKERRVDPQIAVGLLADASWKPSSEPLFAVRWAYSLSEHGIAVNLYGGTS